MVSQIVDLVSAAAKPVRWPTKYQADIAALQKDDRLPADEKRKRIEELKKQISAHLKLMLAL